MFNVNNFKSSLDKIHVNDYTQEQIYSNVVNAKTARKKNIMKRVAIACASIAFVFGVSNTISYAVVNKDIISVIKTVATIETGSTNDVFNTTDDSTYIADNLITVDETYSIDGYSLTMVDYIIEPELKSLLFTMKINAEGCSNEGLRDMLLNSSSHDSLSDWDGFEATDAFLINNLSNELELVLVAPNKKSPSLWTRYELHEDGVYLYCNYIDSEATAFDEISLALKRPEQSSINDVASLIAFEPGKEHTANASVYKINNCTVSVTPIGVLITSDDPSVFNAHELSIIYDNEQLDLIKAGEFVKDNVYKWQKDSNDNVDDYNCQIYICFNKIMRNENIKDIILK